MNTTDFESIKVKQPCFFLGANTGKGFVNHFAQCYRPEKGEKLYIIKGGPGTGKSTFMKELVKNIWTKGIECELYFCSSDPHSLDGVRFPCLGISFVDGTSPHIMEPNMLGITEEVIFLGQYLNSEQLKTQEIIPLYQENSLFHKKASRYLSAASGLIDDCFSIGCNCVNMDEVEQTALRLSKELFIKKDKKGMEMKRFLSGFTPDGGVLFQDTISYFSDTVLTIEDEYGAVSSVFLSLIREYAIRKGYDIITCLCALSPHRKIDHIIIPELRLSFCTTNWFMPITLDTSRRIYAKKFIDLIKLGEYKNRLRFNRRAIEELLDGAYHNLYQAKQVHDALEGHYIAAMDFNGVSEQFQKIQAKICFKK